MPGRIHVSAAAPPRTRATARRRRPSREPQTIAQRQQQKHTRSSQDELLEGQFDPDKIIRKPRKPRARVPKIPASVPEIPASVPEVPASVPEVPANSDGLALEAAVSHAPGLRNSPERGIGYQAIYSQDGTGSIEDDTLGSWYKNVGYLAPLDASAIDVLEQVLPLSTMVAIKRKLTKTKLDRSIGLRDRNVQLDECLPSDPFLQKFHDMKPVQEPSISLPDLHEKVKKYHSDEWRLDIEKAIKDELEATFQRTVMMSMLDRFRLMYNLRDGNQSILDFAVESPWNCPFMPTRALKKEKPDRKHMLSRPKPDISVAFHLRSIIVDGLMTAIPEATRRIMIYEGQDGTRTQRAFHFLMIEAKNADKTSDDKDGRLQILNCASQSLHCLYEFFHEADRKEVECDKVCCTQGALTITNNAGGQGPPAAPPAASAEKDTFVDLFFKEVRVFTAVPSGRAITVRMHRACPVSRLPFPSDEDRPPFQRPILPDYPLQFEYNEVMKLTDDGFSRETLVDTFKKIMVDYGIGQLRPLLQKAATVIATKFDNWEEQKGRQYVLDMKHYSHGQTAPSRPPSQAASQSTRWLSDSESSSSRRPSRSYPASSRGSTNSPAPNFSFANEPVPTQVQPPKKRTKRG